MIYRIREDAVYEIEAPSATEAMRTLMDHLTCAPDGAMHVRNVEVLDRYFLDAVADDGRRGHLVREDVEAAMALGRGDC